MTTSREQKRYKVMISREQKLVDVCFEIGLTVADNSEFFKQKSKEDIAQWIANQLKKCDFPTTPMGMSWGVLSDDRDLPVCNVEG